ncbi:DICT sensory domain-containing protein [Halobacterium jilantaiense]|uniref:DICT domain-containing protein n=1 Tax=Halobacterium jilantaiense TaxID=355548 RepID=A0A1I0N8H9_9EURY|nr:DICT sensory domain-containing protein [Halobacterium jilantaiense]SEV97490.1 DICT domain-containing protein [Halobacterium jilantaiense]
MSLRRLIAEVRGREKTLTVYAPAEADVVDAVREYFASQHVTVRHERTDSGPRAVLSDDGEELASVDADALRKLTSRDLHEVGEAAPYSPLLACLDRTTFTSYDRRQMTQASREIEDRAWRANQGELHTGFQALSNVVTERETYEQLATSGLDVNVYGVPDEDLGATPFSVFGIDTEEVAKTWFVVFDGGGNREQSSALLAEERGEGFYGLWTYEPDLVERALGVLGEFRERA